MCTYMHACTLATALLCHCRRTVASGLSMLAVLYADQEPHQLVCMCHFVLLQVYMLPVLVVAAASSGATAAFVRTRKGRWLRSKPQRRFKLILTDNSDKPFQHLQPQHSNSDSSRNDSSSLSDGATPPGDHSNNSTCDHAVPSSDTSIADRVINQDIQHVHLHEQQQQQQQQQQHAEHPFAAKIAAILKHPHCPDLSTTLPPTNTNSSSASTLSYQKWQASPTPTSLPAAAAAAGGSSVVVPPEPPALSQTPLVWVDTPKKLQKMLQELQGVTCLALDTEHNSQRSYLGVLCLLQLSTGRGSPQEVIDQWHAPTKWHCYLV